MQCIFDCHYVDRIIAPFFVYVGPQPIGWKTVLHINIDTVIVIKKLLGICFFKIVKYLCHDIFFALLTILRLFLLLQVLIKFFKLYVPKNMNSVFKKKMSQDKINNNPTRYFQGFLVFRDILSGALMQLNEPNLSNYIRIMYI